MLKKFSALSARFIVRFPSTKQQKQTRKCPIFSAVFGGFGVPLFSLVFWKSYFSGVLLVLRIFGQMLPKKLGCQYKRAPLFSILWYLAITTIGDLAVGEELLDLNQIQLLNLRFFKLYFFLRNFPDLGSQTFCLEMTRWNKRFDPYRCTWRWEHWNNACGENDYNACGPQSSTWKFGALQSRFQTLLLLER